MKVFSTLFVVLTSSSLVAQPLVNSFDTKESIITLPEVHLTSEISTYTVTLRQHSVSEQIFELDSLTLTDASLTHFNSLTGILHIPSLTLGTEVYKNVDMQLINTPAQLPQFRIIHAEVDKYALRKVFATVETQPVPAVGDAADDPAIWIHPSHPALSTIIGTQKQGGLAIYDLNGKEIQYLREGHMNNVDLRYNFLLGKEKVDLVVTSNRSRNSLVIYKVNPENRKLENVTARTISVTLKDTVYGLCMYHSASLGKYYAFVNDKLGTVEQWEIVDTGTGLVDATKVRTLTVSSQVEGCVADDIRGDFYLAEEDVGIWKFRAEAHQNDERHLIDSTSSEGHLTADVEGLALYYIDQNEGYLIASSQGNSTFTVYQRGEGNEYLGKFQIIAHPSIPIDSVSDTDGIDVVNVALGPLFPYGVFVAQDGSNADPEDNQNFKLVPWESIAEGLKLQKGTPYVFR